LTTSTTNAGTEIVHHAAQQLETGIFHEVWRLLPEFWPVWVLVVISFVGDVIWARSRRRRRQAAYRRR
jgi:hypothetical protein